MGEESMSGSAEAEITEPKKREKKKKKYEGARMTKAQYKRYMKKVQRKLKAEKRKRVLEKHLNSRSKYHIRCRKPVEDEIFDVDEYVKYLKERFKMNGKTGCVGAGRLVHISKTSTTVYVSSEKPFPKRYLKYLTKRYLKRHGLRDYVRVIL